jgi:hypothetical protein
MNRFVIGQRMSAARATLDRLIAKIETRAAANGTDFDAEVTLSERSAWNDAAERLETYSDLFYDC